MFRDNTIDILSWRDKFFTFECYFEAVKKEQKKNLF